jgi:hypothetical protein
VGRGAKNAQLLKIHRYDRLIPRYSGFRPANRIDRSQTPQSAASRRAASSIGLPVSALYPTHRYNRLA